MTNQRDDELQKILEKLQKTNPGESILIASLNYHRAYTSIDTAKEQIVELIQTERQSLIAELERELLKIIGEDDTKGSKFEGSEIPMQFTEVYLRNQLRAELRREVTSLLNNKRGEL